jgi:hypothetical protein
MLLILSRLWSVDTLDFISSFMAVFNLFQGEMMPLGCFCEDFYGQGMKTDCFYKGFDFFPGKVFMGINGAEKAQQLQVMAGIQAPFCQSALSAAGRSQRWPTVHNPIKKLYIS